MSGTAVKLALLALLVALALAGAARPVTVVASVRGKRFEVQAETVAELSAKVEALAGVEASAQCVLFRGKVLGAGEALENAGVSAGDILNVVKGRKPRASIPEVASEPAAPSAAFANAPSSEPEPASPSQSLDEIYGNMDPQKMQAEAMKNMNSFLDSDLDDYFGNAERLEQARQQMLANIDQYEKMMPGFREKTLEIAGDPAKWQEAMLKAKESLVKLKSMRDSGQLSPEAIFGQQPGGPPRAQETELPDKGVDDFADEDE